MVARMNRAYGELRSEIERRGGSMVFDRSDSRWGSWIIHLEDRSARFPSNGRGFPELDRLYVPKPGIENPRHWNEYSTELTAGAVDRLVGLLTPVA